MGADFLIKTSLQLQNGRLALEAHLYEVGTSQTLFSKRFVAPASEAQVLAHTLSNQIVEALTGMPGIFLTKIAMTCDRTGKKEIYSMNIDGTAVHQITNHRSIALVPLGVRTARRSPTPCSRVMLRALRTSIYSNLIFHLLQCDFSRPKKGLTAALLIPRTGKRLRPP